MAFFRVKKIKNKEYAYLVENDWKRKGSRQKVRQYLGRVYRFDLKNNLEFGQFNKIDDIEKYISMNSPEKIVSDLLEWELFRFGINKEEISIDLENRKIKKNNRNVVLCINDGFMCTLTLGNLLGFKAEENDSDGYRLARAFVEAGINVPQEIFVGLFGKFAKPS